ncbi:hypothetical protein [Pseudomonas graminis]|uniref:hypothetical protein n=1 Tax=Pseudomonas graminis TaxID=158627 RepID=UPI003C2614C3
MQNASVSPASLIKQHPDGSADARNCGSELAREDAKEFELKETLHAALIQLGTAWPMARDHS